MRKIKLSISKHFHNKENRAPERPNKHTGKIENAYAYGLFETVEWTPNQLTAHITGGKAICVAALKTQWRKSQNFMSSELVGVDFDEGDCDLDTLAKDDLIRQYGYLIYRTPSYTLEAPRTRAMFILDEPITDEARYKKLVKRLLWHFRSADDLKDGVRIFYGSDVPGHRVVHERVLPVTVLESLTVHPDELPPPPMPRGVKLEGDALRSYVQVAVQNEIDTLVSSRHHRNNALVRASFNMGSLVGSHWAHFPETEAEQILYAAACSNGYVGKDGESAARSTIRSGLRSGARQPRPEPARQSDRHPIVALAVEQPPVLEQPTPPDARIASGHNSVGVVVPPPFDPMSYIKTGKDLIERYKHRLSPDSVPDVVPMPMPFKSLYRFGGYAKVITPGKLVGVVGNTGGGKTIMMESIIDQLRMNGEDVMIFSPEWTGDELTDRMARRFNAPNLEKMYEYQVWKSFMAAGIEGQGAPLTKDDIRGAQHALSVISSWKGELFVIDRARITLTQLLDTIEGVVTSTRQQGYNIRNIVIDYAQVLELNDPTRARTLNDAINEIKALCIDCKLIGWIVSQVTKQSSRESKEQGKTLDAYSAQFLRMDAFNFVISLKLNENELGIPDGTGTISIEKNSIGQRGKLQLVVNLDGGAWLDIVPDEDLAF